MANGAVFVWRMHEFANVDVLASRVHYTVPGVIYALVLELDQFVFPPNQLISIAISKINLIFSFAAICLPATRRQQSQLPLGDLMATG